MAKDVEEAKRTELVQALLDNEFEHTVMIDDPGADDGIVGITDGGALVYLYEKLIDAETQARIDEKIADNPELDEISEDEVSEIQTEVIEHINYNTIGALRYPAHNGEVYPIIIYDVQSFLGL